MKRRDVVKMVGLGFAGVFASKAVQAKESVPSAKFVLNKPQPFAEESEWETGIGAFISGGPPDWILPWYVFGRYKNETQNQNYHDSNFWLLNCDGVWRKPSCGSRDTWLEHYKSKELAERALATFNFELPPRAGDSSLRHDDFIKGYIPVKSRRVLDERLKEGEITPRKLIEFLQRLPDEYMDEVIDTSQKSFDLVLAKNDADQIKLHAWMI